MVQTSAFIAITSEVAPRGRPSERVSATTLFPASITLLELNPEPFPRRKPVLGRSFHLAEPVIGLLALEGRVVPLELDFGIEDFLAYPEVSTDELVVEVL